MVSLIKNQLLKHLSRYTKNLSSDKINLSTFRGEGELSNLQLDENVLTELLELPSWLRLTSAWCNNVSFRISWTKLKSVPITLTLDEVNITVETCENARTETPTMGLQGLAGPQGKYSFIHKVVDGITIIVNTVNVKFISLAFTASVQMARIRVESKTPKWLSGDLRVTRLKDPQKGIVLIFKELSWQTVRIEASSTQDQSLTPLRLLTNHARCRITIKKRISDCSVLASRLVLILDDLLWVLTDSQLKAALHFVDSLSGLIKTSTAATQKTKAQKKLETLPEYQAQIAQQSRQPELAHTTSAQKLFNSYDVRETSYHFFSQRIDLHLCDDEGDGRSCHPELQTGGALQISVQAFQIDYYPYHLAKSDRAHWAKYKETTVQPALWLQQSLNVFREAVYNLCQPNRPQSHAPLERSTASPQQASQTNSGHSTPNSGVQHSVVHKSVTDNLAKLMSACVVLRIEDFTLYRVTTSGKKQIPKEFIAGDKDQSYCPPGMPIVHAEFTYFYYPGDFIFPLPPSKIFVFANPVQIHFDLNSVLWFNSFALNLHESLLRTTVVNESKKSSPTSEPSLMYMDVKLEAIMPRIIIESSADTPVQRDRPKIMQVQATRFTLTNIREMKSSRADLAEALHSLQEGTLIFGTGFPSVGGDLNIVTDRILSHVAANDILTIQSVDPFFSKISRYAMWAEPRDVWCIKLDPVWIEFIGARSLGASKPIPFIDAVPITLWVHGTSTLDATTDTSWNKSKASNSAHETGTINPLDFTNSNSIHSDKILGGPEAKGESNGTTADIHVIAHVSNLVSMQIDHYQYLFLLRLSEEMTELSTFLSLDAERIFQKQNTKKSIIFGCVIPQVEVTLVMPSPTPGKESSGGDAESVLPDSASLGDDLHMNSTNITWPTPPPLDHVRNANTFGGVETPSPITTEPPEGGSYVSNPNTHGYNVQIQSEPQVASVNQGFRQENTGSSRSGRVRNSITDSGFSKEINSGLLSMKKGFTSFMTSIDYALKTGTSDDASDTFSIYSDVSSDSENYAIVMADDKTADCMDVMFRLNPFTNDTALKASPVEMASEVCEEPNYKTNLSSPSEPSEASSWRRRDLVSMATFRLTTVELIRQNQGCVSSLKLQVAALFCDECGAIPWDELQTAHQPKTKFGARCRAWNIASFNPEAPPCIQLRLDETLSPPEQIGNITDKKCIQSWFTSNVDIRVKDLNLDLSMSTVIGIGDLAEDEIISKPLPLNILLENIKLHLIDDRPPVNITSPGPIPINLSLGNIQIKRDANGVFHIQPKDSEKELSHDDDILLRNVQQEKQRDREIFSLQLVLFQLKSDNESLKKQLGLIKESSENTRKEEKQENDILKTYLKTAQDDISILLDEKKTLLDTIRSLQQQLTAAELNKKNEGNR